MPGCAAATPLTVPYAVSTLHPCFRPRLSNVSWDSVRISECLRESLRFSEIQISCLIRSQCPEPSIHYLMPSANLHYGGLLSGYLSCTRWCGQRSLVLFCFAVLVRTIGTIVQACSVMNLMKSSPISVTLDATMPDAVIVQSRLSVFISPSAYSSLTILFM